jgi:hypothetical protein
MTKEKFNTWLKLWRIGLAPDPEILALIVDVPARNSEFYSTILPKAESLCDLGLAMSDRRKHDGITLEQTRCWIGPAEVVREFEETVKIEIDRLKHDLSNEAAQYMGLRYWIIEEGTLASKEWRERWQRSESTVD